MFWRACVVYVCVFCRWSLPLGMYSHFLRIHITCLRNFTKQTTKCAHTIYRITYLRHHKFIYINFDIELLFTIAENSLSLFLHA